MVIKNEMNELPLWSEFIQEYKLNATQVDQFNQYFSLVKKYNELFNLTTIVDPANIISYHFQDSLVVSKFLEFKAISMIADVGTGAGFPGIPLKILFPHLNVKLIEVSNKKIDFLNVVIEQLDLKKCAVINMDWRTMLRKTDEPIDLFISRASLHTDELMRMFRPSCIYNNRTLIYWASKEWQLAKIEEPFFQKEVLYSIKNRTRRLIFFNSARINE